MSSRESDSIDWIRSSIKIRLSSMRFTSGKISSLALRRMRLLVKRMRVSGVLSSWERFAKSRFFSFSALVSASTMRLKLRPTVRYSMGPCSSRLSTDQSPSATRSAAFLKYSIGFESDQVSIMTKGTLMIVISIIRRSGASKSRER